MSETPQFPPNSGPGVTSLGPFFVYDLNPTCARCGHNQADHWPAYAGDSCMDCGCLGFEG